MSNTDAQRPIVSIVMPVFREGADLAGPLTAVRNSIQKCNLPYELVLDDDGSPDNTWQVITEEATRSQVVHALRLT